MDRALRLTAPAGISHHGQETIGDAVWLATNAYSAWGVYETTHIAIGEGSASTVVEDQGVLPVLFGGPDARAWAVVTNPYGDRDREIVRAVGGALGPPLAPFVGNVVPWDLRFDATSTLVGTDMRSLFLFVVEPDATVRTITLASGSFYNLWPIVRLAGGRAVVRHNGEHGNGWMVLERERVVRSVRSDERGYADSEGHRVLTLPAAKWILSGLTAVGDEIAVTAYAKPEGNVPDALWHARIS